MSVSLALCLLVGLGSAPISQQLATQLGWQGSGEGDFMSLAIEYFDPNHQRALTRNSKETMFMADALQQVHLDVPETRALHRQIPGDLTTHCFNSVIIQTDDEYGKPKVPRGEIDRIVAAVAAFPNCTIRTNGYKTFDSDCDYQVAEPASWLSSHGIFMIRVVSNEYHTVVFFRGDLCDPYGLLRAIRSEPEYKQVLRGYEMEVDARTSRIAHDGDGDIILESKPANATFTAPFQLRFTYSWGDCPSGCMGRHAWVVECVPVQEIDGRWTFTTRLVREEGGTLSDEMRACLRCGMCNR